VNYDNTTNNIKLDNHVGGVLYDPWQGDYASVTLPLSVGISAYSALVLVTD
jgi:hypothetical protein